MNHRHSCQDVVKNEGKDSGFMEEGLETQRIRIGNPRELFSVAKASSKYVSWKAWLREFNIGNTQLKRIRRGQNTFPPRAFFGLLTYLSENQKWEVLSEVTFLDKKWGARKGGKKSIKVFKKRLGEDGFHKKLANARMHIKKRHRDDRKFLAKWRAKLKEEDPIKHKIICKKSAKTRSLMFQYDKTLGQKQVRTIKERYGEDFFPKHGLNMLSKIPLSKREKKVRLSAEKAGFEVVPHKSFFDFNVDFVYKNEGGIIAIEEVLSLNKNKALAFFELLVLNEKFKKMKQKSNVPFFVSNWFEVDLGYKTERYPLELMLWCFEKGMIPILMDFESHQATRKRAIEGNLNKDLLAMGINLRLAEREVLLRKGAEVQCKQRHNNQEAMVHNILERKELKPQGKKMCKTKYNTFIVPDNFFEKDGNKYAVFVSNKSERNIIGSSALIKEFVSKDIRTVGITFREDNKGGRRLRKTLFNSYVDYFYSSLEDFEQNF